MRRRLGSSPAHCERGQVGCAKGKPAFRVGDLLTRSLGRLYQPTADGLREMVSLAEGHGTRSRQRRGLPPACPGSGIRPTGALFPWDRAAADRVMLFAQRAVVAEEADEYSHWMMALAHLMACQRDRAVVSAEAHPGNRTEALTGVPARWDRTPGWRPTKSIANNELALRMDARPVERPSPFRPVTRLSRFPPREGGGVRGDCRYRSPPQDWWLALICYAAALAQLGRIAEAEAARDLRRAKPDMTVASQRSPLREGERREHVAEDAEGRAAGR